MPGGLQPHKGALWGLGYCWLECENAAYNTSYHSYDKARKRHYDYLHTTTLPHLKSTNSKKKQVLLTNATFPILYFSVPQATVPSCGALVSPAIHPPD